MPSFHSTLKVLAKIQNPPVKTRSIVCREKGNYDIILTYIYIEVFSHVSTFDIWPIQMKPKVYVLESRFGDGSSSGE